jgi:C-terminus of AA_permease
MCQLPAVTWKRFGAWLAVGLAIYLLYGMRKGLHYPRAREGRKP